MVWHKVEHHKPPFDRLLIVFRPRLGKYTIACLRVSEIGDLVWFTQAKFWMLIADRDYWRLLPKAPYHKYNCSNPKTHVIKTRTGIKKGDKCVTEYRDRIKKESFAMNDG